jgi:hypothetical protein
MMNGDLETEIPAFNTNFAALAKVWPKLPEKIVVSKLARRWGCWFIHIDSIPDPPATMSY